MDRERRRLLPMRKFRQIKNQWMTRMQQPFYVKGNIFISMYNNEQEFSSAFDVDIIVKVLMFRYLWIFRWDTIINFIRYKIYLVSLEPFMKSTKTLIQDNAINWSHELLVLSITLFLWMRLKTGSTWEDLFTHVD